MGTLVEINLHREFDFGDGTVTDYRIAGIEVDCKFSRRFGGWEIPLEAYGHLCLLVWADDTQSRWSAGVVRVDEASLVSSSNRDRKRRLNPAGVDLVTWVYRDVELPENLLLHLPPSVREAIFSHHSGQARVVELFRRVQGRIVSRTSVLTVAQQKDAPKRVRDARKRLREEGTVILGHQGDHPRITEALGLPRPKKGEWVAVRLTNEAAADPGSRSVRLDGRMYRVAQQADSHTSAPLVDARAEACDWDLD